MAYTPQNPNGQAPAANSAPVVLASNQPAVPVFNAVLTSSGSLTAAAQAVTLTLGGRYANTTFQVSGTYVGTLIFEASNDGFASFTAINALRAGDNIILQQISDSAMNDIYRCTTAGLGAVRVRAGVLTSGTAVVTALATESTSGVFLNFPIPAGTNTIGALAANQSVNLNQIAGVAAAAGTGAVTAGTLRVTLATDIIPPAVAEQRAATLHVTATGLVNTAVTASLPAPAAGLFHYITSIQVVKVYSALGVAAGAGVVITSTNLPGTPTWTTEQAAGAVGTAPLIINYQPTTPLKSAGAAVVTTIAAPAQLQTIWRMNVSYFTAP